MFRSCCQFSFASLLQWPIVAFSAENAVWGWILGAWKRESVWFCEKWTIWACYSGHQGDFNTRTEYFLCFFMSFLREAKDECAIRIFFYILDKNYTEALSWRWLSLSIFASSAHIKVSRVIWWKMLFVGRWFLKLPQFFFLLSRVIATYLSLRRISTNIQTTEIIRLKPSSNPWEKKVGADGGILEKKSR